MTDALLASVIRAAKCQLTRACLFCLGRGSECTSAAQRVCHTSLPLSRKCTFLAKRTHHRHFFFAQKIFLMQILTGVATLFDKRARRLDAKKIFTCAEYFSRVQCGHPFTQNTGHKRDECTTRNSKIYLANENWANVPVPADATFSNPTLNPKQTRREWYQGLTRHACTVLFLFAQVLSVTTSNKSEQCSSWQTLIGSGTHVQQSPRLCPQSPSGFISGELSSTQQPSKSVGDKVSPSCKFTVGIKVDVFFHDSHATCSFQKQGHVRVDTVQHGLASYIGRNTDAWV